MTLYQYNLSCPGLDDYLASKGSRIDIKEAFQFFENVHQRLLRLIGKEQDGDYAKVAFYDGRALGKILTVRMIFKLES